MSAESPWADPRLLKLRLEELREQFKATEQKLHAMHEELALMQEQLYELVKTATDRRKP